MTHGEGRDEGLVTGVVIIGLVVMGGGVALIVLLPLWAIRRWRRRNPPREA